MMKSASIVVLLSTLALSAHAQDGAALLRQAEQAYQNVDFEGTQTHALAALRAGGNERAQLVRIYQLLGVSASALGQEEEARDYFVRMLGLDPEAELDESVPPRLRDPYLEARGVWAARQGRLGMEVNLDRAQSALRVEVADPSQMGSILVVHARLEGEAQYQTQELPAQRVASVTVNGAAEADRVEYYVQLLDQHRNVVLEEGTAFQPRSVGRARVEQGAPVAGGSSVFEEPAFWIITVVVLGAAAGITGGVIAESRSHIGAQSAVTIGID